MDGQDGGGKHKTTKPHGNPRPKRGSIMKQIIKDWTGGSSGGNDSGNGGGDAGSSGSAAGGGGGGGGYYGTY